MSYNGVGVNTPRGTGTNGFVASNAAKLPPWKVQLLPQFRALFEEKGKQSYHWNADNFYKPPVHKEPDQEMLEIDRKKDIENKVYKIAEEKGILDQELTEEQLEEELGKIRVVVLADEEEKKRKRKRMKKEELEAVLAQENAGSKFREKRIAHFNAISSQKQQQLKEEKEKIISDALSINDYKEGEAFNEVLQEQKKFERIEKLLEENKRRIESGDENKSRRFGKHDNRHYKDEEDERDKNYINQRDEPKKGRRDSRGGRNRDYDRDDRKGRSFRDHRRDSRGERDRHDKDDDRHRRRSDDKREKRHRESSDSDSSPKKKARHN
jgi:hypothetical protein